MKRHRRWRVWGAVSAVLLVGLILPALSAQAAETKLTFLGSEAVSPTKTAYHYSLTVSDPGILVQDQSTLVLRDMAGVQAQGDAWGWDVDGYTDTTSSYLYTGIDINGDKVDDNASDLGIVRFDTFDVIVSTENTTVGLIEYEVEAEEGKIGTVEGPVASNPPAVYDISGTVFLDGDRSSGDLYDDAVDDILSGVTVELYDSTNTLVASKLSNHVITNGSGAYIGNYNFADLPPGDYTIVVPNSATGPDGEVLPTTPTSRSVTIVDVPVRQQDFGYAPEPLYSISGTTFIDDYDLDGVWDEADGEIAVSDIGPIELKDGSGTVITQTWSTWSPDTGKDGFYIFSDLPAGTYTVDAPETAALGNLIISVGTTDPKDGSITDADVTDVNFGYVEKGFTLPKVEVLGYVFFDANQNGVMDDSEMRFDGIGVTLSGDANQTETTDGDGLADFGEQDQGSYTMAVTDGGAYKLLTYWVATTPTAYDFSIDGSTASPVVREFGFYPDVSKITTSMGNCEITGANHTIGFWKHNVKRAMANISRGTQVSREDLVGWLGEVEDFGPYDDPFELGDSDDFMLWNAYSYLHPPLTGNSGMDKLYRQLMAAELNWVSGMSSSEAALEGAILWYAEWVANNDSGVAGDVAWFIDQWNNLGNAQCGD